MGWACLMYHDVTPDSNIKGGSGDYFSVTRATFDEQLEQVISLGYRCRSIEELVDDPASRRDVACSFDDGNLGQFERAVPALIAHGMTATFFVTTKWVGTPGYVSWEGLREMKTAGMSIQSHTRSHPFLSELGPEALREELRSSREELDAQLGQVTTSLALPGGDSPRSGLQPILREVGYRIIATSRWGINAPRPSPTSQVWVKRCTVRGSMPPADFRAIVEGDRWLSLQKAMREGALRVLRQSLGPTRYAKFRRGFLDR